MTRRASPLLAPACLALAIVAALVLGPLIWSLPPGQTDLAARNQGGSWAHPLGTDQLGRDMLARLLAGGRVSLAVGLAAMTVSLGLGTAIGVAAGMFRRLDGPLMRLTDLFLALPRLPLMLIATTLFAAPLRAALGPEAGPFVLIVGLIGAAAWMEPARILRSETRSLMARDFIDAARLAGLRPPALAAGHILPNIAATMAVSASLGVAAAILMESALSFLGLGFPPDMASWGRLVQEGTQHLGQYPGRALWPGAAITLTALSAAWLGDALRDLADPRARR